MAGPFVARLLFSVGLLWYLRETLCSESREATEGRLGRATAGPKK
mgnify:CR=1 FL=1